MRVIALFVLFLVAAVGRSSAKHTPLDREDDEFAEFDFDVDEDWDEGKAIPINAHPSSKAAVSICRYRSGRRGGGGGGGR